MEITKREIIFSVIIVSAWLIFGFCLTQIFNHIGIESRTQLESAIRIENNPSQFKHAIVGGYGDVWVYGTAKAIDPVECFELGGEYLEVKRVLQKYEKVKKTRDYIDEDGNKQTEEYYEWEWVTKHTDYDSVDQVSFCGQVFDVNQFYTPSYSYIDTVPFKEFLTKCRYKYYGIEPEYSGSAFFNLTGGNIEYKAFALDSTIEEAIERESFDPFVANFCLWIFILFASVFSVYLFVFSENNWLNKN